MKRIAGVAALAFCVVQFGPCLSAQELVKEAAFELSLPAGWSRANQVPRGFEAGFRKDLGEGQEATVLLHREILPVQLDGLSADASVLLKFWDVIIRKRYPDATPIIGAVPRVRGRVQFNGVYKVTDGGAVVRRRYTSFVNGQSSFLVQCTAPPALWASVLSDFDAMLVSLRPGSGPETRQAVTDVAAVEKLRVLLQALVGAWPVDWRCSAKTVDIAATPANGKRTVEITLAFERDDIKRLYQGIKVLFGMFDSGEIDENTDTRHLPKELSDATADGGPFVGLISGIWAVAYLTTLACDPPIELFRVGIADAAGRRVGSISVSREDAAVLVSHANEIKSGQMSAADIRRYIVMFAFE